MKVVIIGGVAGGMGCAARLKRLNENAQITIFEKGPDVSYSGCGMPYYLGGEVADRGKLLIVTPEVLRGRFALDIRTLTEVTAIHRDRKTVSFRKLETNEEGEEPYDHLVISTGSKPVIPPLPGLRPLLPKIYVLRNLQDMDRIMSEIAPGKTAAIIGGGFIGLEVAEALIHRHMQVHLVEMLPQVMAPLDPEMTKPLADELTTKGVQMHLGCACGGFAQNGEGLRVMMAENNTIDVDFALLAIGVAPDTQLAKDAGLAMGIRNSIAVDEHFRTNDPNIFAVGDCVQVIDFVLKTPTLLPLAGPAARAGRIAADNICGRPSTFRGVQGTAVCRVFTYTVGCTGCNEKVLRAASHPYSVSLSAPPNRVAVLGNTPIITKLTFDPTTGKLLGAQCVGKDDSVARRIDAFAMAIQANMSVFDLEEAELSYAPPYGAPKDVVNMAGMVSANLIRGDHLAVRWPDVHEGDVVVDVRNPPELTQNGPLHIRSAVNIPLGQLRKRLDEIPRDRPVFVSCQSGLRSYVAQRILQQNGFDVRNVMGGFIGSKLYPH